MRPSRPATVLAIAVMAGSSLALSGPIVTPDASGSCWLARGGDTPADESDDLRLCREDVWFHDTGTKVGNVRDVTGYPGWDTTPPSSSVTEGGGGGVFATSAMHQTDSPWDDRVAMVAADTLTGPLETLAVELYLFPPAGMAQGEETFRVDALLEIDGKPVATLGDSTVPMETAGDAVRRIRFAWTGILRRMEQRGIDPADEHDVRLVVHGTGIATNGAVFVYDTTEVPAGMVVNPDPDELDPAWTRNA